MIRPALALIGAFLLTAQTPAPTTSSDCPTPAVDTHAFVAAAAFRVKAPRGGPLALVPVNDENARERGLMCVVSVPLGRGMIFVFGDGDISRGFWMKNTLVGLDMVFVTSAGKVTSVAANVPATPDGTPDDKIGRRAGLGRFVIELGAGDAARHGITAGTHLTLPPLVVKS